MDPKESEQNGNRWGRRRRRRRQDPFSVSVSLWIHSLTNTGWDSYSCRKTLAVRTMGSRRDSLELTSGEEVDVYGGIQSRSFRKLDISGNESFFDPGKWVPDKPWSGRQRRRARPRKYSTTVVDVVVHRPSRKNCVNQHQQAENGKRCQERGDECACGHHFLSCSCSSGSASSASGWSVTESLLETGR